MKRQAFFPGNVFPPAAGQPCYPFLEFGDCPKSNTPLACRHGHTHKTDKMNIQKVTSQVGSNPITFETGKLAKLADGAVVVTSGETVVLVTAVSQTKVKSGQTWFPLSVEYKEKASAAGQFPGGYFMREGRPT